MYVFIYTEYITAISYIYIRVHYMAHTRTAAWSAWFIASLFYAYQYILRVIPGVIMPDVLNRFSIDAATFGQFSGAYYIGYSLIHIPLGVMLDRFGPKKIMPLYILIAAIGMVPLIATHWWIYPIIGRFFVGIGSSAAVLGAFKIIRFMFPESQFSRMLSFTFIMGLLGAMYGGSPLNYICGIFGYQAVITVLIAFGLVLSVLMYICIPEMPIRQTKSIKADVLALFTSGKLLLACVCAGLTMGPLEGFADVWGSGFLKYVYGLDSVIAASLPSCIFLGMCFGGPLLSFIAETYKAYIQTIILAIACMFVSFLALIFGFVNVSLMSILFVLIGICCGDKVLILHVTPRFVAPELVGMTSAVTNMILMTFGYVFHVSIGSVVDYMGGPTSAQAYTYGVAVIPAGLCIGMIGFTLLWLCEKRDERNKIVTGVIEE